MGLLRSLARKVVGRVAGGGADAPRPADRAADRAADRPAARPAPPPPRAVEPVVEDAEALSTIACSPQELKERIGAGEPVVLLDVREPFETAGGVVPGARLIPLGQLRARWEEVKDANEVVCYCASGMRSLDAAHFLREKGLFNATSMDGGISAWMEVGGPVVRPA